MKLYPMFKALVILITLVSCEPHKTTTSETKRITIDSIKLSAPPIEEYQESMLTKIIKLEEKYANAPLTDSLLLLDIKSGVSRKEFDRIIARKEISKIFFSKESIQADRYQFRISEETPNIYCNAREYLHDTCGLAGFEVNILIKNDTLINKEAQILIDWGNGAEKEGNKRLLSDLISNYQESIISHYTRKYGESSIQNSENIAWFIGRKMIHLHLKNFEFIMENYEESGDIGLAYVDYQDLGLMKLYKEAYKREAVAKLNI